MKLNRKEKQDYLETEKRYNKFQIPLMIGMIKHIENAHEFSSFQHKFDEDYLIETYEEIINTNYSKIKKKENSVLTYCYQNSEKAGRKFEKQVIALRQMMTSLVEQRDKEKQEKKLQAKKELVVNYTEQEKNNNDFSLTPSSNQKIAKFGINDKNHIIKQLQ